jgi:hypothetical protein
MKTARIKTASILGIAVLAFGLLAFAEPGQKANVRTENGERVVRNPKTPVAGPGGAPAAVSVIEDLVIGNDTSREDHWFGFLNSLDVDASGNIYTVDPKNIRIRIFAPDGSLVKAFGREGQGPGEFSGPGGIIATVDGTFAVSDVLNGRISFFSREGAHLKDISFGTYRIGDLAIDGRSDLFATHTQRPIGDKLTWELIKFDPDLKPLLKIHSISVPFKLRVVNLIPDRLFFALAGDDRLAWMVSNDYAVQVVDSSGKAVMKIIKDRDPQKITEKDRDKFIIARFPSGAPPQFEIQTPEYFPAASGFMTDDNGRIYIRTYDTDGRIGVAMDVFDADGLYVARFFVPEDEDTVTVRNDKLYSIVKDPASGNPLVKRYTLKWK